ncbi:ATP-binding protein [uncultured Anaerotruncus sp.]|uniref:ATP-binding protein n=1 Tax=uncultured Anaerotruncus sp. TaxID=905011 RepID=UPI00267200A2|nr:ATP-binding protein [uncultured Anaerotruncus sp.]
MTFETADREPLQAVLALGKRCDGGEILRAPQGFAEDGAFGRVCAAFGLDARATAAFAWCLYRAACLRPFPEPRELAALCAAEGGAPAPLPLLFSPEAGGLLRTACECAFGREPRLPAWVRPIAPPAGESYHGGALPAALDAFLERCSAGEDLVPAMACLTGGPGTGKKYLLNECCFRRGCGMLAADCAAIGTDDLPELAGLALLFDALVCLDRYEDAHAPLAEGLFRWFSLVLCSARTPVSAPEGCRAFFEREVPPPAAPERLRAMRELFPGQPDAELSRAASLGRTPVGAPVQAAARLRAETAAGGPGDLREALRRENGQALNQSAQRIQNGKRMEDLVLPPEQKRQLESLCAFARGRETVWKRWGFARTIPGGQGLTALFYGASGTGKTLAASVVANELGLPLYRVDLSQLISKYIGETQKNIGRIFDAAESADCILFFDEADALFSRRTEAADAQDRYANAEIAYLLQRTEQYDGIILLATNLLQNFDEAFRRRIGFMIRFPTPDEAMREALWRGIFPEEAPLSDIDYPLLARELELTGAGIRACALNAARMAAAENGEINLERLCRAAREEYQKLGKTFPARFGQRFPTGKELDG